jgi:lipocalin
MKLTVLVLMAVISVLRAQKPHAIPVPISNISLLQGEWYMVLEYNSEFDNLIPIGLTCQMWDLSISGSTVNVTVASIINGNTEFNNINFGYSVNSSSVWTEAQTGGKYGWVYLEPIVHNWALLASMDYQEAYLFTRNPSINTTIVTEVITLMKGEDYYIDSENYYIIETTNCQQGMLEANWFV